MSIKELKDKTMQEVFDFIVNHLRTQNKRCGKSNGSCMYRGPDGMKCAAGSIISDDEYKTEMEGTIFSGVCIKYFQEEWSKNHDLVAKMQGIHDRFEVEQWEEMFIVAAEEFDLKYTPK